jgi:hypothetical protein
LASGDDSTAATTDVAIYGSLITGVYAVVASVLSSNPFANLSKSITILTIVSCMIFVVLLGCVYMMRWDMLDHNKMFYLGRAKTIERNKLVYDMPWFSEYMMGGNVDSKRRSYNAEDESTSYDELHEKFEEYKSGEGVIVINDDDIEIDSHLAFDNKSGGELENVKRIDRFLDTVIPSKIIMSTSMMIGTFIRSLAKYHSYVFFFKRNPPSLSRTMSYLGMW